MAKVRIIARPLAVAVVISAIFLPAALGASASPAQQIYGIVLSAVQHVNTESNSTQAADYKAADKQAQPCSTALVSLLPGQPAAVTNATISALQNELYVTYTATARRSALGPLASAARKVSVVVATARRRGERLAPSISALTALGKAVASQDRLQFCKDYKGWSRAGFRPAREPKGTRASTALYDELTAATGALANIADGGHPLGLPLSAAAVTRLRTATSLAVARLAEDQRDADAQLTSFLAGAPVALPPSTPTGATGPTGASGPTGATGPGA